MIGNALPEEYSPPRHPSNGFGVPPALAAAALTAIIGGRNAAFFIPKNVERDAGDIPIAILVRGKGSTDRVRLSLPSKTALALHVWIHERGPNDGPLFISVDPGAGRAGRGGRPRALEERLSGEGVARILAALAARANVSARVRPHGLRHTAITALLDHGAGLRKAQRFSRHADPRTLTRYDDNRTDIAGEMAKRLSDLI